VSCSRSPMNVPVQEIEASGSPTHSRSHDDISDSPYWNTDLAPTRVCDANGDEGHRGAVDFDVGVHPDIHAGFVAHLRGMNCGSRAYDFLVTSLCSSHDPQCPRGHKVRHPLPCVLRASFGTLARTCPPCCAPWSVRVVRNSGVDCGDAIYKILAVLFLSWPRARRYPCWHQCGAILLFLSFVHQYMVIYRGIDTIRFLLNIKAPLLIALGLCCFGGRGARPVALSDACQAVCVRPRPAKARQFWFISFRAHRHDRLLATLSLNIRTSRAMQNRS